jgi:hypothetical protein
MMEFQKRETDAFQKQSLFFVKEFLGFLGGSSLRGGSSSSSSRVRFLLLDFVAMR